MLRCVIAKQGVTHIRIALEFFDTCSSIEHGMLAFLHNNNVLNFFHFVFLSFTGLRRVLMVLTLVGLALPVRFFLEHSLGFISSKFHGAILVFLSTWVVNTEKEEAVRLWVVCSTRCI